MTANTLLPVPTAASLCRVVLVAACAAADVGVASAQQTRIDYNHSFELESMGSPARPWGWGYAWGRAGFVRDSLVARHGSWSLRSLPSAAQRNAFSVWTRVDPARASRLRVSGWIRSEALTDGDAGFGVMYSTSGGPVVDTIPEQRVTGTTAWTNVAYETVIPEGVEWVQPIGHVRGGGTVWFDHIEILIDGEPLPDWILPPPPGDAEVEALRSHVIPLVSVDPGSGFEDLRPLASFFRDARVVGLGESSHGSSVFFRTRHRLLEWAVRELGFTHFAIEDNTTVVRLVNEYVRTGAGSLDSLMAGLFTVWRTQEVRDLIEWMRAWNATGGSPVEFVGIDMQDPLVAVDSVLAFLRRHDPGFLPVATQHYADMAAAWRAAYNPSRSNEAYDAWIAGARSVHEHLSRERTTYAREAGEEEVAWAVQQARLALQSATMMRGAAAGARESAMAENLEWHLARRPGARAILWAHNVHISLRRGSTGALLRESFGSAYRPVALTSFEGEYRARDIVTGQWSTAKHFPARPGTTEHAFNSIGVPYFFLDLREAASRPLMRWLAEPRPSRNTGTEGVDYDFASVALATHFDAVIFVRVDSPAVPLAPRTPAPFR